MLFRLTHILQHLINFITNLLSLWLRIWLGTPSVLVRVDYRISGGLIGKIGTLENLLTKPDVSQKFKMLID